MASGVVRELARNVMGTNPEDVSPHEETGRDFVDHLQRQNSLSFVWATNDSVYSNNVDRWIHGDSRSPVHAAVQPSRLATNQRSTLAVSSSFDSTGFWHVAAMLLPLFNFGVNQNWRCTPSSVFNTVELLLSQVSGFCSRARSRLRMLAQEQGARDMFAGAMDVVLVVYAIGFLLISMYQASVFQQF